MAGDARKAKETRRRGELEPSGAFSARGCNTSKV